MTVKTMRYAPARITQTKPVEEQHTNSKGEWNNTDPLDDEKLFELIQRNMRRPKVEKQINREQALFRLQTMLKANADYWEGNVGGAERRLKLLLQARGDDRDARFLLALCHLREGDAKSALAVLEPLARSLRASVQKIPQSAFLPLKLGKAELMRSVALYLSGEDEMGWSVLQEAVDLLESAQQKGKRFGPAVDFPKGFASPLAAARTLSAEPRQSLDWMDVQLIPY